MGGDGIERIGRENELDFVHLEHSSVLTGQGVLRLGQDPNQSIHVEILHGRHHRETPDELGDQAVLHQVLRHDLVEQVGWPPIGLAADLGAEADSTTPHAVGDDVLEATESSGTDEEDVGGVELNEFLMGVLAPTLRRDRSHCALQDLEESLLYPFSRNVPRDGRVLGLAGDLVDLVDVDDPLLSPVDVVVGGLEQLEEDVLHVLSDIASLGETGGVGDGEWDVELASEGLGQKRLARSRGADEEDVRLLQLDIALDLTTTDPLVVVVDGDGELLLGVFLAHHVVVEIRVDLDRLGQLGEGDFLGGGELFFDDLVTEIDALVADVDARPGDQFLDLLLRLPAEAALEQLTAVTESCHRVLNLLRWRLPPQAPDG